MTAESNITKDMSISLLSFFVKLNIINLMQRGHWRTLALVLTVESNKLATECIA